MIILKQQFQKKSATVRVAMIAATDALGELRALYLKKSGMLRVTRTVASHALPGLPDLSPQRSSRRG
jgi:hypothetical protein